MNANTSLLSFVIPVKDEEATIKELYKGISDNVGKLGYGFEIIFIDDGSTDASWKEILILSEADSRVSGIRFRRNLGKANALTAGFEAARGEIVFTMDADLQDDPKEIGRFLEKLDEGYDVVSGWKKTRHDPWHKVLPSRVFNEMISRMIGVRLHDHNCGFKCYRAQVIKDVELYGEMHRMVPSLASLRGYRSAEIPVQHHPRMHGKSKYGIRRFLRGFMDLLTVYFLKNFRERPLHLFGGFALLAIIFGGFLSTISSLGLVGAGARTLGIATMTAALPIAAIGFLAELMIHRRTPREQTLAISERTRQPMELVTDISTAQAEPQQPLVLVIDDDRGTRTLLNSYLTRAGFRVQQAENGTEAMSKISSETRVVMLDMKMPGISGLDVLREIRHRFAHVKVVMVSASDDLESAVAAMKMGAFDYLTKPVQSKPLIGVVQRAVQIQALTENHLFAA